MAKINGHWDSKFNAIADILSAAIDSGEDLGASVAITVDGQFAVDIWGGWTSEDKSAPWEKDTITNVWSTTKTMTALAALILIERGKLDPYAPVARYWPEFAANGKANIQVRHLLSHTSGLSGWDQPITLQDVYDWDKSTALLAAQKPWWEPGTASGYHAFTQGHLVGEVIRRIDGRQLGQFFAEEIAGPLHADFHIGLPSTEDARVSNVVVPPPIEPPGEIDLTSIAAKTAMGPALQPSDAWTPGWRRAQIGAANGHGNARSVAKIQTVLANNGVSGGTRLLSKPVIDLVFEEQSNSIDLLIGLPIRFSLGYALPNPTWPYIPDGKRCFWGGWGGSMVLVDADRHMTIAYVMNKMSNCVVGNATAERIVSTIYQTIDP